MDDEKEDAIKSGIYSKLHDGRSVRVVLPQGFKVLKDISLDDNIYFVCFIGFKKPPNQLSESLFNKIWKIDSKLIEAFAAHTDILAYLTAERIGGQDWGNLVIFKSLDAIGKWRNATVHQEAVAYVFIYYIRIIYFILIYYCQIRFVC